MVDSKIIHDEKNRSELYKTEDKGQNFVAIASGQSGVGKTFFAINLAQALAYLKQKNLFFDADLGLANIDVQLGLKLGSGLKSVVEDEKTLNQVVSFVDKIKSDVISNQFGLISLSSIPLGRLQVLCDDLYLLARNYDKVILDMGSSEDKSVMVLSGMVMTLVLVCSDEPSSMVEAYDLMRVVRYQNPKVKIYLVVNQANSLQEGIRTYETFLKASEGFFNFKPELLGVIRRDTRVRDAIRNNTTMFNRYVTSETTQDILRIARKLVGEDVSDEK